MTPAGDVIYVIVQNCIIPYVEQNNRYKFKIKKKEYKFKWLNFFFRNVMSKTFLQKILDND